MEKAIRRFAVWLKHKTDYWVIAPEVWVLIDAENWEAAKAAVDLARRKWPNDPETTYASTIVERFK